MNQSAAFFVRSPNTETTRSYMGSPHLHTVLVKSAETENRFFLLEVRTQPGAEPPPHFLLTPEETAELLPHYPGFGVRRHQNAHS